jgi:hypothetical protein
VIPVAKSQIKLTAYVDAFKRHDSGGNAWALLMDSQGVVVSEIIKHVPLPTETLRAARLEAVRQALEAAYSAGAAYVDVILPDAALSATLSSPKSIEPALFSLFIRIRALRHAFRSVSFSCGSINTLSTLSLGMA